MIQPPRQRREVQWPWLTGLLCVTVAGCWNPGAELTPAQIELVEQNLLDAPPAMDYMVDADMGGEVTYLGLDVSPVPVKPGQPLTLVHYWRADDILFDWQPFVHLRPKGGGIINADHVPVKGLYPLSMWKKGQIVRDEQSIDMPVKMGSELHVHVGLYRGTGRIQVTVGPGVKDDKIVVAVIPVEP